MKKYKKLIKKINSKLKTLENAVESASSNSATKHKEASSNYGALNGNNDISSGRNIIQITVRDRSRRVAVPDPDHPGEDFIKTEF